jgi:hypothetical protein
MYKSSAMYEEKFALSSTKRIFTHMLTEKKGMNMVERRFLNGKLFNKQIVDEKKSKHSLVGGGRKKVSN